MKRTKKLLALVLAMMMAFSIMAVTAAAHGDEGVMPLYDVARCSCGGTVTRTSTPIGSYKGQVTGCDSHRAVSHTHNYVVMHNHTQCDSCNSSTRDWTTNVDSGCNWPN